MSNTFGPWHAAPDTDHPDHWLIFDEFTKDLADIRPWMPMHETIANAHLMAAAPELFNACIMVLGFFEHGTPMNLSQIRKAVAKALDLPKVLA